MTAMDETTRITDDPDLSGVLGELDDAAKARIREQLESADSRLAELHGTLSERSGRSSWETTGISLQTFDSGQAMITGVVTDPEEGLTFTVELRPRNFFDEERPWRPDEPPRAMVTDAWDVEGEVQVMTVTRIQGRKYTVQESAAELSEQRHETPEAAVAALVSYADDLIELALSRDPVAASWQSEQEEGEGEELPSSAGGEDFGEESSEY
jgi:hypothetical protein